MINSSKFIAALIIVLCVNSSCFSGEAMLFDDPSLVGYRADGRIYGFYTAENKKFSCEFFFFQVERNSNEFKKDGYTGANILTFIPSDKSFEFLKRDKEFDIDGILYRNEKEWIIKTATGQAGCENATGGFIFDLGSMEATRFYSTKEIPAIGIRVVKDKSFLYDFLDGVFFARKGYLTKWNAVVVIETRGQFSLVRFSDPRLNSESYGKVTTGWVRSADLVNPFPPASKEPKP